MAMFTFSVLDLLLQLLSKKSIWLSYVTWLISRQFTNVSEIGEIFQNIYFEEHLQTTASVHS